MPDQPKPNEPAAAMHIGPREEIGQLAQNERHTLECLGAAVVSVWSSLPRGTQRAIFEYAAAQQAWDTQALRKQIAQFLHDRNE